MTSEKVATEVTGTSLQPLKSAPLEGELLPRRVPPIPSGPIPPFAEAERMPVAGGDILRDVFADFGRIFGGKP